MDAKYKQLLVRIKSIEEHLGIRYSPADFPVNEFPDYNTHIDESYGLLHRFEKFMEKLSEKKSK